MLGALLFASTAGAQPVASLGAARQTLGVLSSRSEKESAPFISSLYHGLRENGFSEDIFAIQFRWADGNYDLLPSLADELIRENVSVIITAGSEPSALAAKSATSRTPIVFVIGGDPVSNGLVDSLNHPGRNLTGFSAFSSDLVKTRFSLLRELLPNAKNFAYLCNPKNSITAADWREAVNAAALVDVALTRSEVSTVDEIYPAFARAHDVSDGMVLQLDPFIGSQRHAMIKIALELKIPSIYYYGYFIPDGGLISYGPDLAEGYRKAGNYAMRIIRGEAPGDLPVVLPTKFDLCLNMRTARMFGITIPTSVLARADSIVED